MLPIKMKYLNEIIDVYSFNIHDGVCYVTGWLRTSKTWITTKIENITPFESKNTIYE